MSEVDSYNMNNDIDKSLAINGRNITNLGLFRKYVTIPK
jgi:miniconductance mechanosensitive channel